MPLVDNFIGRPGTGGNVLNAIGGGGQRVPDADWVRKRQPYLDSRGRACVTITDVDGRWTVNDSNGGERKPLLTSYLVSDLANRGYPMPITANATTLTIYAWREMQRGILKEARQKLRAVADLEGASSVGGFNAYARMTYEYQAMSDPGSAQVDMDARTDGRNDTPLAIIRSVPLPITHSDFGHSDRELEVSKNGDMPLDLVGAETAGRRVGESLEDQLIGNVTGVTYGTQTAGVGTHTGTSTVYGYRNFPQRLTKTNFTAPTSASPETTYNEILAALQQLLTQYFSGPFMLYHSLDWNQYMNRQFSVAGGNNAGETLLTMIQKIPQISGVRLLERMTSTFTFLFVQMTSDVVQLINGRDITTIQWQEKGGLEHRYKVMAIKPALLKSTYSSKTGILHGTTA